MLHIHGEQGWDCKIEEEEQVEILPGDDEQCLVSHPVLVCKKVLNDNLASPFSLASRKMFFSVHCQTLSS